MTIRKATFHDIGAMADLLGELFRIEDDFTINAPTQIRGLELLIQNPQNVVLVAEADGEVVAMVSMQQLISTAMGSKVGVIEDLIVSEHHRGRGIGTALIDTVISEARTKGYARVALGADIRNQPALSFYAQYGFNETHLSIFHKIID